MARKLNELGVHSTLTSTDKYITQSSGVDLQVSLGDIRDFILDSVFPIGMVYTQFPNTSDPSTLGWPGTWTNVSSDYAGDFFRAEGGNASAFESGEQGDAFQGHRHPLPNGIVFYPGNGNFREGSGSHGQYNISLSAYDPTSDGTNGTPRTASETRPINRTIRIWKRIA